MLDEICDCVHVKVPVMISMTLPAAYHEDSVKHLLAYALLVTRWQSAVLRVEEFDQRLTASGLSSFSTTTMVVSS